MLPVGVLALVRVLRPAPTSRTIEVARSLGMDPGTFDSLRQMCARLDRGDDLRPAEWSLVKQSLADTNVHAQIQAVHVLSFMKTSAYRQEARDLARPFLKSSNLYAEAAALDALWRLQDPLWRTEAISRTGRSEEIIKSAATSILARENLKNDKESSRLQSR